MRDAFYRICEASNNGNLNDLEVATLLRRSQDLTAVVLAVEQLTRGVSNGQKEKKAENDLKDTEKRANTQNSEQSSMPGQHNQSNAEAAKDIASAVTKMVTTVIKNDYTLEVCMLYLTREPKPSNNKGSSHAAEGKKIRSICENIVERDSGALAKAQREAKDAVEKAGQAKGEADALRKQLQAAGEEAGKTQVKADALRKQLQAVREEAGKTQVKADALRKQLQAAGEEAGKTQVKADALRNQLQAAREEAGKTQVKAETLRNQLQAAREEAGETRGEAEALRKQLQTAREEAGKTQVKADALRDQLQAAREKAGETRGEAEALRKQLQAARKEADKARGKAEALRNQLQLQAAPKKPDEIIKQTNSSEPENGETKKPETPNSGQNKADGSNDPQSSGDTGSVGTDQGSQNQATQ